MNQQFRRFRSAIEKLMYNTFIRADKAINHRVFGGHWNQTLSRNAGSKIGRATGTNTQIGTDIVHGALVVGGLFVVGGLLGAFSK